MNDSTIADIFSNIATPTGWLTVLGFAAVFLVFGILLFRESNKERIKGSILGLYSQDLTALARSGKLDPVIGRTDEIERVIQILSRRTKNNAVLVGDSGVGKTAIVEGLANMIANSEVPDPIKGKRILSLDLSGLVAGTKYRGEFEKRLKAILDEVISSQREIILFIDELHTLAEAGEASGAIDASDILKPALARGQLQAIGATTQKEYEQYIVQDVTLERRFQPVLVNEPSKEQTLAIITGLRARYEQHHKVTFSDEALKAAVELSDTCLPDRRFPDKAIDAMDEAGAKIRLSVIKNNTANTTPTVTAADVNSVIEDWARDLVCFNSHDNKNKGRPSTPIPASSGIPQNTGSGVQPPANEVHSS